MAKRSPKYPIFGIKTAIEKLAEFYKIEKQATVPRDVAVKAWGYTTTSGPALQTMATLIQYGLLDRIGGQNVKISELGMDIVLPKSETDKNEAIQQAAQKPTIFKELLKQYPNDIPSDGTLKAYLIRRKPTGYIENAAKILIKSYRETLDFTNLLSKEYNDKVEIGDLVNWESQGTLQFPEPKKIKGFSDCGKWVFVEGSKTGLPIEEIKLIGKAKSMETIETQQIQEPPKSPFYKPEKEEIKPYNFPLPGGPASVLFSQNNKPSKEDVDALVDYLKLFSRKLGPSESEEVENENE